jgi:putative membrane protein
MEIGQEELKLNDRLAIDRTAMAADRTLMAWTRTSISMISFGFSIYKIMESFREHEMTITGNPNGPRNLGLFLIAVGTVSLVMGMMEHWHTKRSLQKKPRFLLLNPSFLTSMTIILLGTLLFATIILKHEMF